MTVCRDGAYIKSAYSSSGHLTRFPALTLGPQSLHYSSQGPGPSCLHAICARVQSAHSDLKVHTCDLKNDLKVKIAFLSTQWPCFLSGRG